MVFLSGNNLSNIIPTATTLKSVRMHQAALYVGSEYGLCEISFLLDSSFLFRQSSAPSFQGFCLNSGLIQRNSPTSFQNTDLRGHIINSLTNQVLSIVLDNTPISQATGLPRATLFVATQGGLTRIAHDNTVSHWDDLGAGVAVVSNMGILKDTLIFGVDNSYTAKWIHSQDMTLPMSNSRYSNTVYVTYHLKKWFQSVSPLYFGGISSYPRAFTSEALATSSLPHRQLRNDITRAFLMITKFTAAQAA